MGYKAQNIHVLAYLAACTENMTPAHSQEHILCLSSTLGI